MKRSLALSVVLLCSAAWADPEGYKPPPPAKLSDAMTAKRPVSGEFMGLYLVGKKVGYYYSNVKFVPGRTDQVIATSEFIFNANVGAKATMRSLKDTRIYESKPGGKLLSFTVEQAGDGGDQTLEATNTVTGLRILRKRPGVPNEVLTRKPSLEVIEDADQVRVAIKRGLKVVGTITDAMDLDNYGVVTEFKGRETKMMGGVKVETQVAVTLSEKEKVPTTAWVDKEGRILEVSFGESMKAVAESEEMAKRPNTDTVEVFGLTRITLPNPPSPVSREVPGEMKMVVTGLPESFRKDTYRQKYKTTGNQTEITITALPVKPKKLQRPLVDPNGGTNLKSTLAVEADHPEIVALAKKILGTEKDAYASALKISAWVGQNMVKDYGSSSDRATDALRKMRGDCTEHALLTTALLRASGIPAKRVDGVVYMMNDDNVPALYWHEWVEAFVGEWTQLDPTFGQAVANASHFQVGEEGSAEITPLIGQIKVLKVQ